MKITKKHCFLAVLAIAVLAGVGFAARDTVADWRKERILSAQIQEILSLTKADEAADFHEKADGLRMLVTNNSQHRIDADFYKLWRDQTLIAGAVLDYMHGRRGELPHLECSARTGLLNHLYDAAGYRSRVIVLWAPDKNLASHTLLEVLNPETGRWEIEDPDHDVYWRNKKTMLRASAPDLIADPEAHEPCDPQGCGWAYMEAHKPRALILRPYLKIASLIDKPGDMRLTVYGEGVDPARSYTLNGETGTFCGLVQKNCRDGFMKVQDYKER